jgi:CelD/BcsL family acetyltransferase involved in cellulose biosynthesis
MNPTGRFERVAALLMSNVIGESERDFPSPFAISASTDPGQSLLPKRLTVSAYGPADWPQVAPIWTELSRVSPYSSFYISADWMAAWLGVFGEKLSLQMLVFEEHGHPVGACLLTCALERRGPFRVLRIYLNTGGEPVPERTLMEFNNILCIPGKEDAVAQALGSYLHALVWDEFAIGGICPGAVLESLQKKAFPDVRPKLNLRSTFFVDLDELRGSGGAYLDSLSPNTRGQIRRSLKRYAQHGGIKTEIAPDLPTAELFFAEMCRLHQSRWTHRGEEGAFAPGRRLEFHRALIRYAYEKGSIHLVRVTAGAETIGILYNFVQDGKVYFFQSGFNYGGDRRLKPGLATHACAIQYYLEKGFSKYDLLVGDARYKRSLAKHSAPMAWVLFPRQTFKIFIIDSLRFLKRRTKRDKQTQFSTWA